MTAALSRAVLALAASCLGRHRQQWALAMQAELEAAREDGKPLVFALGCLFAAWRELPAHAEGRFILASHLLVFALLIPAAALPLWSLLTDFPYSPFGQFGAQAPLLLSDANRAAVPSLAALLAVLAAAHLRLAWLVLERDWARAGAVATLAAATTVTFLILLAVVFGGGSSAPRQAAWLAAELAAVAALARWHSRSFAGSAEAVA